MSAQTPVYIYNQRQYVVFLDTTNGAIATRRYDIVYAKELIIQQGVNNVIEFSFINQDQKAINMLNYAGSSPIIFRIISNINSTILYQKQLTAMLPLTGIYKLVMTGDEAAALPTEQCYYSLEVVGAENEAVYTDAQGVGRGVVRIMTSVFPPVIRSIPISIPAHRYPQTNNVSTYYTSTYETNGNIINTYQCNYSNFIGNISFEGCNVADFVNNYTIDTVTANGVTANTFTYGDSYANIIYNGSEGYTVMGYHPYIRIQINNVGSNTTPNFGSNQSNTTANNQSTLYGDMVNAYVR
jgi:hypothetical protein